MSLGVGLVCCSDGPQWAENSELAKRDAAESNSVQIEETCAAGGGYSSPTPADLSSGRVHPSLASIWKDRQCAAQHRL